MSTASEPSPPTLFCFGHGYTAGFLSRGLKAAGWRVLGTHRQADASQAMPADDVATRIFDRAHPLSDARALLAEATHLLISVPPDEQGDPVLDVHGDDIAAARDLRWIGYLSTTGVYGDRAGGWVDEAAALRPTGQRGRRRVAAEAQWLDLWRCYRAPVHVFRLAGIYGPGRNVLDAVRSGSARRIVKPGQVFSRIHVADIARVLGASMANPAPGTIYNVCDDDPAAPAEVVAFACELLGVSPPPAVSIEQAELSEMARSFYADNKRVSNRRIKEELGVSLLYPSYRDGLAALLKA
ncbi:MAG TPA: SDR family oxidoreductase [Stellaceae bacterium]|nr:SDR family oxidoreductase [Stellaceae bacterium]